MSYGDVYHVDIGSSCGEDYMEHHEGLVQGSPISSSSFSFTIHGRVKEADKRVVKLGGCARFGMDDG